MTVADYHMNAEAYVAAAEEESYIAAMETCGGMFTEHEREMFDEAFTAREFPLLDVAERVMLDLETMNVTCNVGMGLPHDDVYREEDYNWYVRIPRYGAWVEPHTVTFEADAVVREWEDEQHHRDVCERCGLYKTGRGSAWCDVCPL